MYHCRYIRRHQRKSSPASLQSPPPMIPTRLGSVIPTWLATCNLWPWSRNLGGIFPGPGSVFDLADPTWSNRSLTYRAILTAWQPPDSFARTQNNKRYVYSRRELQSWSGASFDVQCWFYGCYIARHYGRFLRWKETCTPLLFQRQLAVVTFTDAQITAVLTSVGNWRNVQSRHPSLVHMLHFQKLHAVAYTLRANLTTCSC